MDFFNDALALINSNVHTAPFIIFGLLFLAGFNLPVSEDIMIFTSAILAAKNPEYTYQLFAGLFLGAYISDLICYALMGRYLGHKLFKIKFFANVVTPEKLEKINYFFKKYGVLTLIFGRFIPFGVRNALFISAGLGKMSALKFALADLLACTISVVTYFYIYYTFGELAIEYVKQSNYVIATIAVIILIIVAVNKLKKKATT